MRLFDENTSLYYEIKEDYIVILETLRNVEKVLIPKEIDGIEVKRIQKKAFLGCKLLKEIYIPDSVEHIGDYAFSLCDHLKTISFPHKDIKFGQSIFKGDGEIKNIYVRRQDIDSETMDSASYLLGASPIWMNAEYLVDITQAGAEDWFGRWDQKLLDILNRKEDEDYHLYVLCGEEDLHFDYDQYIEYIREQRAGLCMYRLMHDAKLIDDNRKKYTDYLIRMSSEEYIVENTVGQLPVRSKNEFGKMPPVFHYLLSKHGDDKEYFELLIKIGIITKDNRESLLFQMKDRHPQTKAYLINSFCDDSDAGDFFDDLLL